MLFARQRTSNAFNNFFVVLSNEQGKEKEYNFNFFVIFSNDQGEEEEEEGLRSVDSGPTQTGKKGALLDLRSFSVILQLNALTYNNYIQN